MFMNWRALIFIYQNRLIIYEPEYAVIIMYLSMMMYFMDHAFVKPATLRRHVCTGCYEIKGLRCRDAKGLDAARGGTGGMLPSYYPPIIFFKFETKMPCTCNACLLAVRKVCSPLQC